MTSPDLHQKTAEHSILLSFGQPDPETLPIAELCEALLHVMNGPEVGAALQYGAEQGTRSLLEVLVEKINREQWLAVRPENLMITAGSTHAVDMLTRLHTQPGSVLMLEAPSYVDSLHLFRDQELDLHPLPMDEEGLIPGALAEEIERLHARGLAPRLLYTVPTFHNPTGRTLSEARRGEIIELAHRHGFWIVEDDVYRDLSFIETVPPSFYALGGGKQVLNIGSFSKTLAPGLRLGWLLGSEDAIQRCINCGTMQMGGGANPFAAQIVAEYCRSGHWETHILRLRSLYKMRRDIALSALGRYMPSDVGWTHPAGGFFIWLSLPKNVFAQHVKRQALQKGVSLVVGEGFFVNPSDGQHNLRLAYSYTAPDEIDTGIRILAQVIHETRMVEQ